jgi:serine/threonine-protein kinase
VRYLAVTRDQDRRPVPRAQRSITIRLLGAMDIRDRRRCEARAVLAQPRRLALLAYLAVAPPQDFLRRSTLLATFWPEQDEGHGRAALRQALHFLRHALGPEVLVTRGDEEVRLDHDACWCDVRAFDAAIAARRFEEAVELYRGDLLAGFYIADGAEFEPWLDRHRDRLRRAFTSALETLAIRCEEASDHAGAADHWHRLVACVPENGRVVLRLMQALAHAGDRTAALRQADAYAALLQREFGADPDPAVTALVELLRRPPRAS